MASHARLVLVDLLTALRAAHTHYDLTTVSGTHKVIIDDGQPPPIAPPWVVLAAPQVKVEHNAETPLTQYRVVGKVQWWAYVAATTESTEARAFAALDLAFDVVKAIQTAHKTPSFTTLFTLSLLEPAIEETEVVGDASVGGVPYGAARGMLLYEALTDGGI